MKYAIPFFLLATPALAHDGAHMHPHGIEGWVVGLGVLVIASAAFLAAKVQNK